MHFLHAQLLIARIGFIFLMIKAWKRAVGIDLKAHFQAVDIRVTPSESGNSGTVTVLKKHSEEHDDDPIYRVNSYHPYMVTSQLGALIWLYEHYDCRRVGGVLTLIERAIPLECRKVRSLLLDDRIMRGLYFFRYSMVYPPDNSKDITIDEPKTDEYSSLVSSIVPISLTKTSFGVNLSKFAQFMGIPSFVPSEAEYIMQSSLNRLGFELLELLDHCEVIMKSTNYHSTAVTTLLEICDFTNFLTRNRRCMCSIVNVKDLAILSNVYEVPLYLKHSTIRLRYPLRWTDIIKEFSGDLYGPKFRQLLHYAKGITDSV